MVATYIGPRNTNKAVLRTGGLQSPHKPAGQIRLVSQYMDERAQKLLSYVFREPPTSASRQLIIMSERGDTTGNAGRRIGRPRREQVNDTMERSWTLHRFRQHQQRNDLPSWQHDEATAGAELVAAACLYSI